MSDLRTADQRLQKYIDRRKRARGLHVEEVHTFDAGGESEAVLRLSDIEAVLAALAQELAQPKELRGVADALESGDGMWRSCSGCYETNEGYPPNGAYFSKPMDCYLGCGCSECGGLGAIWDTTDYDEMADAMERSMGQTVVAQEPAQPCLTCSGHGQVCHHSSDGSWDCINCPDCNAAPPAVQELVKLPLAVSSDELAALRRFDECVSDGQGYDVEPSMMKRLTQIGFLRRVTAGIYEHTSFGLSVLAGEFNAAPQPAVQEPVAYLYHDGTSLDSFLKQERIGLCVHSYRFSITPLKYYTNGLPLYAAPQPAEQEPARQIGVIRFDAHQHPYASLTTCYDENGNAWAPETPIYAAPQPAVQEPVKRLSDEQIERCIQQAVTAGELSWHGFKPDANGFYTIPVVSQMHLQLARAIEAAVLGEKP